MYYILYNYVVSYSIENYKIEIKFLIRRIIKKLFKVATLSLSFDLKIASSYTSLYKLKRNINIFVFKVKCLQVILSVNCAVVVKILYV